MPFGKNTGHRKGFVCMDEKNKTRFMMFVTPRIDINKWFDNETETTFYDLYLNGSYECRYQTLEDLLERIELLCKVTGGLL